MTSHISSVMGFLTTSLHKNCQNDVKLLETWWFWPILGKVERAELTCDVIKKSCSTFLIKFWLYLCTSEQKLQTPDHCVSVTISVDKVLHDLYWEPVKKGDEFGPYLRTSSSHDVFTNSVLRIYDFTYVISFVYFYTRRGLLVIEYHTLETNAIVATYLW